MSIQNLSFFGPAGIATSFPNGQPGDRVVSVNVIRADANTTVGQDISGLFDPTLDGDGKIVQTNIYSITGPVMFLALLARGN
jgi:hypothetical protein